MDVAINGKETGRLVFKLYKDSSPKTVENFRSLCVGDKGTNLLFWGFCR